MQLSGGRASARPSRSLAHELKWLPGRVAGTEPDRAWRWNGLNFDRLEVGMVCRRADGAWGRWTGRGWQEIPVRERTLVRVTAARPHTTLRHELCIVVEMMDRGEGPEAWCTPWPEMDWRRSVMMPVILVEPVSHPDEVRCTPIIHEPSWLGHPDDPPDDEYHYHATVW